MSRIQIAVLVAACALGFVGFKALFTGQEQSAEKANSKSVNALNGSYSTGLLYPARRSNLDGTLVIQDPPYTLSLDFSDDGTVFSANTRGVQHKGTYQISDHKIRFVWDDPKLPDEAEMQGGVIFWGNRRYERK